MLDDFNQKVHPMYDDRLWSEFHETTLDARIADIISTLYKNNSDASLITQDNLVLECYNYLYMCARFPAAHITTAKIIHDILSHIDYNSTQLTPLLKSAIRIAQSRAPKR